MLEMKTTRSQDLARRAAVCIGIAGTLALSALPLRPVVAETRGFDFQIAWGHVTLAETTVRLSVLGERYSLFGTGRTEGLFGLLFDWEGWSRTDGVAAAGRKRPVTHVNQGTWNGNLRRTRVDWNVAGAPRTQSEPPPDETEVTPVPAASTLDTVDPFTVVLTVIDSLKEKGRCEAREKVWDGRRRYDLVIQHVGPDVLTADRPWSYAGPSVKCSMRIERIGGFRRDTSSWKAKDDSGHRMIWVADLGGGNYAPVRAELETAFGTVVGRLKPAAAGDGPQEQVDLEQAASTGAR